MYLLGSSVLHTSTKMTSITVDGTVDGWANLEQMCSVAASDVSAGAARPPKAGVSHP